MGTKAEILSQLRLIPGIKDLKPKGDGFSAPGLPFNIPKGIVAEFTGSAPTEFIVEFLVMNKAFIVFWAEENQRIFPPYLEQRGFDITTVTFGTYGKDLPEAMSDLLRNKIYDVIVTPNTFTDVNLDRFGRLARDAETILFMLAKENLATSLHIDLQLEIHRGTEEDAFRHKVLKLKHGRI